MRTRRKKANGATEQPEGSPPEAGSNVTKATVLDHVDNLSTLLRKKKEADSAVSNAWKAAKRDGIEKKELKLAMEAAALTTDEREGVDRRYALYREWLGKPVGYQASLVDQIDALAAEDIPAAREAQRQAEENHRRTEAFAAGYAAGQAGANTSSNPYQPGSAEHQDWSSGWPEGQRAAVEALGGPA